jgi:manganese transport protein
MADGAMKRKKGGFGPGLVITAAFIGPGTVTTCTLAGAGFGYALLWTMVFATITALILQEMSGRLGLATGKGLSQVLREQSPSPFIRYLTLSLVVSAITFGCAAFEAGNIIGGALGLSAITGVPLPLWVLLISCSAFFLLLSGSYHLVEKVLVFLVFTMSIAFIATMIIVKPELSPIIKGVIIPRFPAQSLYLIVALIGTTVVPYNLFLHSSIAKEKWASAEGIPAMRRDLVVAVIIGGVISTAIIITASTAFFGKGVEITTAGDMAEQLVPLLKGGANLFFGIGLFAAGISSAITAPLAAAYATSGALGWDGGIRDNRFRLIWFIVLIAGVIVSLAGVKPIPAIVFAQAANGFILPLLALFLLLVMNNRQLLKGKANTVLLNIFGGLVVGIIFIIATLNILRLFGFGR